MFMIILYCRCICSHQHKDHWFDLIPDDSNTCPCRPVRAQQAGQITTKTGNLIILTSALLAFSHKFIALRHTVIFVIN